MTEHANKKPEFKIVIKHNESYLNLAWALTLLTGPVDEFMLKLAEGYFRVCVLDKDNTQLYIAIPELNELNLLKADIEVIDQGEQKKK